MSWERVGLGALHRNDEGQADAAVGTRASQQLAAEGRGVPVSQIQQEDKDMTVRGVATAAGLVAGLPLGPLGAALGGTAAGELAKAAQEAARPQPPTPTASSAQETPAPQRTPVIAGKR